MKTLMLVVFLISIKAGAQSSGPSFQNLPIENSYDTQSPPIGVDLMAGDSKGVTVYPNPANDHIIVSLAGRFKDKKEIRIISNVGQPVLQVGNLRDNTYMLDVSRLQRGIYMIEVVSKGNVTRTKWVKQ